MPEPVKGQGRYMAGLDGLRALAVLAVVAYHLNLKFASGGLLGVGVFFVLSGYLITDLLVEEWRGNKRLNLKNFWWRRARRLLPGLFLMLVVVVLWVTLLHPDQLYALRGDVVAAVLYVSNWWFVFHHVSYFSSFGPPSPVGHLWSLAVEEQFYLIWPILLLLGLHYTPKRGALTGLTLIISIISILSMALIYHPGTDPSRVYYGTDTRAFALLIGAALAFLWPSRQLSNNISPRGRLTLDLIGGGGLLTILFMIWSTSEYESFLYRGGMVLLCLATAAAIAAIAHPASRLGHLMGVRPLRWLGVRSYGIYLWHFPVIILTSPQVNTVGVNIPRAVLQVTTSIILAALSWKFVEDPIRRGGLRVLWENIRIHGVRRGRLVGATSVLLALAVSCVGMSRAIPAITNNALATGGGHSQGGSASSSAQGQGGGGRVESVTSTGTGGPQTTGSHSVNSTTSGTGILLGPSVTGGASRTSSTSGITNNSATSSSSKVSSHPPAQSTQSVTAIGDSVMIDTEPYLKKQLPGIVVSAHVGRQMYQAPSVIAQLKRQGELGHIVIVELGTNGPFTQPQLLSLLDSLGKSRKVVLINTRVPRQWQDVVNSTLANAAAKFPNISLVNWYQASTDKNAYFYPDGVHLNPEGSKAYAKLVAQAVESIRAK